MTGPASVTGNNVVVVGSGAAGLAAAIAACKAGANVTILESTEYVGGTTALSGGVGWFPVNHKETTGEGRDSVELARQYLQSLAVGDTDADMSEHFIAQAGAAAQWLEENSAIEWDLLPYPDYHCEMDGGLEAGGRSLAARLVTPRPDVAALLRPALSWRAPVEHLEVMTNTMDPEVIEQRKKTGTVTMGQALIAALLTTCIDLGIDIRTNSRAHTLLRDDDRVVGVRVTSINGNVEDIFDLFGSVILANGGFERDPAYAQAFLRLPNPAPTGAPGAKADGLRMAMSVGAELGNMSEAWWAPTMHIPGDEISGEPLYRLILSERSRPGAIMIDGHGRRFVNESQNYNDVGRSLQSFDAGSYSFDRARSWLIFDQRYRDSYVVGPVLPTDPDPEFFLTAETLTELADAMDVSPINLTATINEFNADASAGVDTLFNRGASSYDQALGDPNSDHPNLRPIERGPFYAVQVYAGTLGTKGGPKTDTDGRVRAVTGGVIEGLYAAGNAAASSFGFAYPGAGGTIGPAITFGILAGRAAALDTSRVNT
jgi:succinate dehydrogenase/fumarate reductase flavoprotein subunit